MCGVPYHAADGYIARADSRGIQSSHLRTDGAAGPGKKLVRREVSRVITPGTATDVAVLDARENNFLAAVAQDTATRNDWPGVGGLVHGRIPGYGIYRRGAPRKNCGMNCNCCGRARRCFPALSSCLRPRRTPCSMAQAAWKARLEDWIFQRDYAERILREQFGVAELTGFGLDAHVQAMCAAGAVVHYLRENAARGDDAPSVEALQHLDRIRYYQQQDALVLDPVSVRNLELLAADFHRRDQDQRADDINCRAGFHGDRDGRAAAALVDPAPTDRSRTPSRRDWTRWGICCSRPLYAEKFAKNCAESRTWSV